MWKRWNGTRYERVTDDAWDVFDMIEQVYREREGVRGGTGEAQVNDQHKPVLVPLGIEKRGQEGSRMPVMMDYEFEIIRLKDVDQLSFRKIAKSIGYTLGAVTGLYYRARGRLAKQASQHMAWIEENGIDIDAWEEEEVA